jgi:hypothetical protein
MLMVFEVHHVANLDPNDIISEEVRNETMAQIMTPAEARAVGFQGARDAEPGRGLTYIACSKRDAQFIQNRLEANEAVTGFATHDIGG